MTDIEFKMTPEHIDQLLVDAVLQSNAGDAIRKAAKKAIDDVIGTEWSRTSVVQEAVTKIIRDEATRIVNDELNDSIRAFAEMLLEPAHSAGIKTPPDANKYNKEEFPHWHVYTLVQLGAPMAHASVHWDNANAIAKIPEDRIRTLTTDDLDEYGVSYPMHQRDF